MWEIFLLEVVKLKYIDEIIRTMNTELERILFCVDQLSEDQVWQRFKPNMNSIGNLCIHLAGNEYQHFISGIGKKPNIRHRSLEFTSDRTYLKEELKELLIKTRKESLEILQNLKEDDMKRPVKVLYSAADWNIMKDRSPEEARNPGYTRKIEVILYQVCEHYGYHTGQIVLLTKFLKDVDSSITGYKH